MNDRYRTMFVPPHLRPLLADYLARHQTPAGHPMPFSTLMTQLLTTFLTDHATPQEEKPL